jgi:NAD(P)-dependent dehydrogenase (short-subunit alcohol dehydrogenase family)
MAGAKGSPLNTKGYAVPEYQCSKAAVNMLTAINSVVFGEEGIAVVSA